MFCFCHRGTAATACQRPSAEDQGKETTRRLTAGAWLQLVLAVTLVAGALVAGAASAAIANMHFFLLSSYRTVADWRWWHPVAYRKPG